MQIVHVKLLTCMQGSYSSLTVYPGMLTLHQIQWTDTPHSTIQCNMTEDTSIKLDFHMFATMVVITPAIAEQTTKLIVTFTTQTIPIQKLSFHERLDTIPEKPTENYEQDHMHSTLNRYLHRHSLAMNSITVQSLPVIGSHRGSRLSVGFWRNNSGLNSLIFTKFETKVTKPNIHFNQEITLQGAGSRPPGKVSFDIFNSIQTFTMSEFECNLNESQ